MRALQLEQMNQGSMVNVAPQTQQQQVTPQEPMAVKQG